MKLLVAITLLISVLIPFGVCADEGKGEPFSGFIKYVKYHADFEVNSDGTYVETGDLIVGVLTDEGVDSANQTDISYSESLEEAEILSAYTLKKDGRRIDVPAANIQERAAVAGGGPMYSDIKTRVIIFPDVAAGDRVGYSYRIIHKTALFPGHFYLTQAFAKFMAYDDVRISVSVPAGSLDLKIHAAGVEGGRVEDKDGRMRWVWTYKNNEVAIPEYGATDPIDNNPHIIVTSFKDYGTIAAAYEKRARPKAAVTDKVSALAEELTRGITGTREQAKVLYTWVAQNIHYAGNCIGVGSVVPHDAEMVLSNRLGDCKDHTALLQALLAAKGIESTPALVNSGLNYKLPEVPTVTVFNHVINYIPALDLYADSTSEYTPFGMLPPGVSGKPAIHTANFTGVRRTPSTDYRANISRTEMVIHIHEDGSADGETHNEDTGVFSIGIKAAVARMQPNMEDIIMRGILARSGYTGTGTLVKADPRELTDRYTYGGKYHLNNVMNIPGPAALRISPVFSSAAPIFSVIGDLNLPERKLNYECYGGSSIEEYTIYLPENVKIIALPKDVHIEGVTVRYDSTYHQSNRTVTAVRKFEDRSPGNFCTPQDDREFRPVARAIQKDLRSQIIYE